MSLRGRDCAIALLFASFFTAATELRAANITLQGAFASDDVVQLFDVVLNSAASVDLRTYGYAGGTASNAQAIPRGGFDPVLTLFDASGIFIVENDDGAGVASDALTLQAFDARITTTLSSGHYILALTQYDNFVTGLSLSDGFDEAGHGNFTADPSFTAGPPCASGQFRDTSDITGACRNGNWTVDFLNVTSATARSAAAVPEPSTYGLLLLGSLMLLRRFGASRR
jgi:hypothetical protein